MSKSLPVYELEQWIKSGNAMGRIVARTLDGAFSSLREFDSHPAMPDMALRGAGYCVEWVELIDANGCPIWLNDPSFAPARFEPLRLRWIGAKTIADPRYVPCECPVKAEPAVMTPTMAPSQPVLPLYIEAATEATMRAAVALGNQAADWLRAKGLTL